MARKRKAPKTHPCAFCGEPFTRTAHRVGAAGMSGIMRKGGWPPVPRAQRYCSDNCRKRAAVAKKRTGAPGAPVNLSERRRVVMNGRVAYIAGLCQREAADQNRMRRMRGSVRLVGKGPTAEVLPSRLPNEVLPEKMRRPKAGKNGAKNGGKVKRRYETECR